MATPDFSYYPLSVVVSEVRGESTHSHGRTRFHVDSEGILHVFHASDEDADTMFFRLVPMKQQWVEDEDES